MTKPRRAPWVIPVVLVTSLEALAVGLLLRGGAAAAGVHLLAVAAASASLGEARSQRALMAAFTFGLPVLGAPVALLVLTTHRRGELASSLAPPARASRPLTVEDVRRLTDGLSACEALLSGTPDEKSATVAMLSRNPDGGSVALLRRAVAGPDPDLAVEAALALEDMNAELEARAVTVHRELAGDLDFEHALADANVLAEAIHVGLPDPSTVGALAADARRGYERAAALEPARWPEIAVRWARLEAEARITEDGMALGDGDGGGDDDDLA